MARTGRSQWHDARADRRRPQRRHKGRRTKRGARVTVTVLPPWKSMPSQPLLRSAPAGAPRRAQQGLERATKVRRAKTRVAVVQKCRTVASYRQVKTNQAPMNLRD